MRKKGEEELLLRPKIDELLKQTDSKYALVILSARRARQINDYLNSLQKEGGLALGRPPFVESKSNKPLTIALEEIAAKKIWSERVAEGIK